VLDYFGIEIKEGDYLFYAIRSGNHASAKVGKVIKAYTYNGRDTVTIISSRLGTKGSFVHGENAMIIPLSKALSIAPFLKNF
jgi:hypothetical protein